MKHTIGWNVFYVSEGEHKCMMHGTRAKARDHMRDLKLFLTTAFICRVVLVDGKIRYEKTR